MALKLSNIVVSFIIFAVLVNLIGGVYSGFQKEYGFNKTYVDEDGMDVIDRLNDINIIGGLNQTTTSVYKIVAPTGGPFDIVGAFVAAGFGLLKIIGGIITFPIEIIGVITGFYFVPPIVSIAVAMTFIVYIIFIIISQFIGRGDM